MSGHLTRRARKTNIRSGSMHIEVFLRQQEHLLCDIGSDEVFENFLGVWLFFQVVHEVVTIPRHEVAVVRGGQGNLKVW